MDLKLALHRPTGVQDVLVAVEPAATVGRLAERLVAVDPDTTATPETTGPVTLAVRGPGGWTVLPPAHPVGDCDLRSGGSIAVVAAGAHPRTADEDPVVGLLSIRTGADAVRELPLRAGSWTIGRGATADIGLADPLVSRRHALLRVGRDAHLSDLGSANGIQVAGATVAAARPTREPVRLGDTDLTVRMLTAAAGEPPLVAFNRPPVLRPEYEGLDEEIADPPRRPGGQVFPTLSILLPVVLGFVLWKVTGSLLTGLFLGLSSMLLVGAALEQGLHGRRTHRRAAAAYRAELADTRARFDAARRDEVDARRLEHPALSDLRAAILDRSAQLWSRRRNDQRFGELRVGLGRRPSRNALSLPRRTDGDPGLLAEARALTTTLADIDDVPVPLGLRAAGAIGVWGPPGPRADAARAAVLHLAALHSPEDLVVTAVVPDRARADWAWLRWLPHCATAARLDGAALGADPESCHRIVAALEQAIADRADRGRWPVLVLVVEDGAPVERGRLVELAERGGAVGVHLLWSALGAEDLPAACRGVLAVGPGGLGSVGYADTGEVVRDVRTEALDAATAESLARLLAPVIDAGAALDRQTDLPRSASFIEAVGRGAVTRPEAIVERWRDHDPVDAGPRTRVRRPGSLRAQVGQGADAPVHLDLHEHGPHALIGGTTGAGKSEFLQSWILGLATEHSPERVTFLLVDYKGGAAFNEIVRLPHTVGLVTDLTPRLVGRALTSLRAEVRYRERILAAAGAPDLVELLRRGDPAAPPALVVVVDEFAALVQEVPEFVDGVIDVAQRGRSLGVHLILATQRPAGVITANLRANTNLRVALRMADRDDSIDVLGNGDAAGFDPAVPGRAMAKLGPGRPVAFQALYVGGRTSDAPAPPDVAVTTIGFGLAQTWRSPEGPGGGTPTDGPNDVHRLADVVGASARLAGLAKPRKPWLPELPASVDLLDLVGTGDAGLVFGRLDDPARQRQTVVSYQPDRDGALVVTGGSGSGKSGALRALAIAAGLGGSWHVYGLDFGSNGLAGLEPLPHVGSIVPGDDHERVVRLLDWLREVVDERAVRYARPGAGAPDEPRILLLLDNVGAFRTAYEAGYHQRLLDRLPAIALDGRSVGVHVAVTADRPGVVPAALASAAGLQLTLRMVQDIDLATVGLRPDAFAADSPPGRGYVDGREVQVAALGGAQDAARQTERIERLAVELRSAGVGEAQPVGRLSDHVDLSALRPEVDGQPTIGLAGDTLAEIGFTAAGTFLIAGPPQSGRTTALLTAVTSLRRARSGLRLAYVGVPTSPLVGRDGPEWERIAVTYDEVGALARDWTVLAAAADHDEPSLAVVIENLPSFTDTPAQEPLEQLVTTLATAGQVVLGDGESSALTSSWGLPRVMKAGRHGLLLQPEQQDGDNVLRTTLPRVRRAEFPPGRGIYVRAGRNRTVQVALPA